MNDLEVWRVVERQPAYLVSSHGRVQRVGGRVLSPGVTDRGYAKVHLGRKMQAYVHDLVAEAFHGRRPAGHDVDHVDWDRLNNAASNLRWLPLAVNRCRWKDRDHRGRNVWEVLDKREAAPPDHEPLTPAEQAELHAELEAAGWTEGANHAS